MTYGLVASAMILLAIWKGNWTMKLWAKHILQEEFRQIQQERLLSRQLCQNQKQEIVQLKLAVHRLEEKLQQETLSHGRRL